MVSITSPASPGDELILFRPAACYACATRIRPQVPEGRYLCCSSGARAHNLVVITLHKQSSLAGVRCPGYLVVPDFSTAEETKGLRDRALQLVDGFEPSTTSVFSTKNQVLS